VAIFHNWLLNFLKPAWYSSLKKISKDKQGFTETVTDGFGRDPRHLQLLLLSDAD